MKSISLHLPWHSLMAAFLIPLLAFLLACGPGAEPTAVPTAAPTATPTTPAAGPTITSPGPVATPTPTTQAGPVSTPSEKPKYGGRIQYIEDDYPQDYDFGSSNDFGYIAAWLSTNVFIGTADENSAKGAVYCEICTDWHLEDGGKTMVFDMIHGIKFHNGKEMVAADVAYSLKKLMGQIDGIPSPRVGTIKEYITSIETPSRYQVKVHMVRPSVYVPKILSSTSGVIYPDGTTRQMLQEKPYGSGPFVLKRVETGASMHFDKNPNYFKPGQPYVDGVDYTVVADTSTRQAAMLTGKVQIFQLFSLPYMDKLWGLVAAGKLNSGVAHAGQLSGVIWPNSKSPFTDIRIRQAVYLALDRTILGEVAQGKYSVPHLLSLGAPNEFARPVDQIWNVVPGWGTGAKKVQEIEQAKKLLIDAGYPNGIDLTWTSGNLTSTSQAEPGAQMLGNIGIRIKFTINADQTQRYKEYETLNYQLGTLGNQVPTSDPDEAIGGYWITGGARNWFGYGNPEVDRLYVLMSGELDPVKRKELFRQIENLIAVENVAWAALPRTDKYVWWWKQVKGHYVALDGMRYIARGLRFDTEWLDQ